MAGRRARLAVSNEQCFGFDKNLMLERFISSSAHLHRTDCSCFWHSYYSSAGLRRPPLLRRGNHPPAQALSRKLCLFVIPLNSLAKHN